MGDKEKGFKLENEMGIAKDSEERNIGMGG